MTFNNAVTVELQFIVPGLGLVVTEMDSEDDAKEFIATMFEGACWACPFNGGPHADVMTREDWLDQTPDQSWEFALLDGEQVAVIVRRITPTPGQVS